MRAQGLMLTLPAACAAALAAACGGPHMTPPDGADADAAADAGPASARVTLTGAAMVEAPAPAAEQLVVQFDVENTGGAPLANVGVLNARLTSAGLVLVVQLARDPPAPITPIAPGERRAFVYRADVVPLGLCTPALRAQPNPHHGLATLALTVLTSVGGTAFSNQDVEVTCNEAPPPDGGPDGPPPGTSCAQTLDDACAAADIPGMFNIHCSRTWDAALADTYYCGMSSIIEQAFDCFDYKLRLVSNGSQAWYSYYYDAASGQLVAVLFDNPPAAETCTAGPAAGFSLRMCPIQLPLDRCGQTPDGGRTRD